MVQRVKKFTPQALLSAPRRSAGIPNASCSKVLYTVSTYSFETHKKTNELRVLDCRTGESHELAKDDDCSDPTWLDQDTFACLHAEKDGTTSLYVASVTEVIRTQKLRESHYVAGKIDGPAANLKVKRLGHNSYAVVFSTEASPDGSVYNPERAKKVPTHSTGKLYTGLYVRHWDRYETKEKNALWYGRLSSRHCHGGKLQLSKLTNVTTAVGLESPMRPFGGADNFDVSADAIIFVARDPDLNVALTTRCNVYLLLVRSWEGDETAQLLQIVVPGFDGAVTCPCFNHDGSRAAFLAMKKSGYEADKNQLFVFHRVPANQQPVRACSSSEAGHWDRSPDSVCFAADGTSLLLTAEEHGAKKLFLLKQNYQQSEPWPLTERGYISDVRCLNNGCAFISGNSLTDNSYYAIVDFSGLSARGESAHETWINSNTDHGAKFGLKREQVSYIWTPASNPKVNERIHSIVIRPSNFSSGKKYPVAYIIHGGPQSSWGDNWSTRWNLAMFAEQGYIVVAPNPTGSTGYGQALVDAIKGNWGGDPYHDIVNVFDWVGENMPEADNDRAVALGASYGGYMVNWIQGHDLGRKMKAIVCHDGITTFAGMLSTDELYFLFYDIGRPAWHDPRSKPARDDEDLGLGEWHRWDPSQHFVNWSTPELVIHSSKDYRIPISDGLAAFNVLQTRGIESQFLTFPDENHWILKPENSLAWHKVVLNWIHKHVGLPPFTTEDIDSDEFWGGIKEDSNETTVSMPTQGKPAI